MKSKLIIILFAVVSMAVLQNIFTQRHGWIYKYDTSGYHLYLPAIFIYNDVTQLDFYSSIDDTYQPSGNEKNYCIYPLPNGNRINRYSIGVAVHEAPSFLIAHFINTRWLHYPPDGYSSPYEVATFISALFYVLLGLIAIRKLLSKYFTDTVVAATITIIAFGTNIYYYTIFAVGGSHAYSFFHMALLVWYTHSLYTQKQGKYFYYIAIVLGLAFITRPVNIIFVLVPLLWGVYNKQSIQQRLLFLKKYIPHIAGSIITLAAVMMIQLGFWKYVTGSWYYDGYGQEGFVWQQPEILKGMFSFRKGWLIYAPLSALGLVGIYLMQKRFREQIPLMIAFLALYTYITYSWWSWWYGGCYASRPMVDITPLLALPMAVCVERIFTLRKKFLQYSTVAIILLLIALQVFQSYQYYKKVIHYDRMTAQYYFRMFFRTTPPTEAEEEWLLPPRELGKEMSERLQKANDQTRFNQGTPLK